jgi:hypothetical protein
MLEDTSSAWCMEKRVIRDSSLGIPLSKQGEVRHVSRVCMHSVESTTTCHLLVCACKALTMHRVPSNHKASPRGFGF